MTSLPENRKISVASANNQEEETSSLPKKGKISSLASTSKQEAISSSSSSPPPRWIHDVFLSFRGEDTRNKFTSHLQAALKQRGINAYLDDRDLERGSFIEPTLWKAIEESRFSIIVFSKNYASSSWCLDEVVKIVRCKEEKGHIPLPVFYDVDPSEVAEQTENYGKAFVEHEFRESPEKLQSWKDSLGIVAKLGGWDVRSRNESEIIRVIVEDISRKLSCTISRTSKDLVGIERRIKQLNGFLDEASNDTHFIGIFGMGGLGKTTLAREVYERIHPEFEGACFLANVRDVYAKGGVIPLQEQLLSATLRQNISLQNYYEGIAHIQNRLKYKKVLLILDDVDKLEQMEKLAKEHGWFGAGSRIIITSRDKHVLTAHGVTEIYEVDKLNDDEALILFSLKAFKQDQPKDGYQELSKLIVSYADGLPLALEVIGSFLYKRSTREWESEINKLKESPKKDIFDVLRISFDGLDELEKEIFLDIACFFKGMKEDRVTRILDSCGFNACIGIRVLIEKSLITVSQNELWMHDLLQIMGKKIVHQESSKNASQRSRLWKYDDVFDALMNSMGTAEVESIFLDLSKQKEATWNVEAFSNMRKLRLLKIRNVELSSGPQYFSNKLRFLEWHAFPSKSLPSSFQPRELVELHMSHSSIEQLWYGSKSLPNLKIINLSYSLHLTSTADFTGTPNLERLILEGCGSLSEVHPSIGLLKKLEYMNLVDCRSLRSLPSSLKMDSLKLLTLNGCSRLDGFPKIVRNMNCLVTLHLDETAIQELPSYIWYFSGLVELSLKNCQRLKTLPRHISGLSSLEKLDLSGCSRLQNLPEDLGKVECLKELDASGTAIRELPESTFLLKNLEVLSFDGCRRICLMRPSFSRLYSLTMLNLSDCNVSEGVLPEDIGQLSTLRSVDLSRNNFLTLPRSISQLFRLEMLNLEDCRMLGSLLKVPSRIQNVNLNGCTSLKQIPDPFFLTGNKRLEFKCLNCWNLYADIGCDILGLKMLREYLKRGPSRPGFSIAVPGSKIHGWFFYQKEGSSINIEIPPKVDSNHNRCEGIAACVAFSAYRSPSSLEGCGVPYLYCHFKTNGREDYPSDMWINWSFIQVLSDHLWLFYLSFDHLTYWQHECVNNIELSFRSCEPGIKVENCGVCLISSSFSWTGQLAEPVSITALASISICRVVHEQWEKVQRDNALKKAEEVRRSQTESSSADLPQYFSEFSFSEIKEATHNFDPSLEIRGRYGIIYTGFLRHTHVAVMTRSFYTLKRAADYQQEVDIFSKMRHPNLITLVAACPKARTLIYEYLPYGSLEDRLRCRNNSPPLSWQTRIRIATELCSVLIFLHSSKPHSIVHGDLKPANILLDDNFMIKLSAFGNCRLLDHREASGNNATAYPRRPISKFPYMDPEFLHTGERTSKSDVYSFGIILLRLLTGRKVLGIAKEVQYAVDKGNLKTLLDPLAGDWPIMQAEQLSNLAMRCCQMNSKNRPDLASEVWRILEPMKASCGGLSFLQLGSEEHFQPPHFLCPILQEIVRDPHVAADGFTYEAEALRGWLDCGHDTSPMTNLKLSENAVLPSRASPLTGGYDFPRDRGLHGCTQFI